MVLGFSPIPGGWALGFLNHQQHYILHIYHPCYRKPIEKDRLPPLLPETNFTQKSSSGCLGSCVEVAWRPTDSLLSPNLSERNHRNLFGWPRADVSQVLNYPLPKFNSSPLKIDGKGRGSTLLLGWYIFRGELWNLPAGLFLTIGLCFCSKILYVCPDPWRDDSNWPQYISNGLVQPPTSCDMTLFVCFDPLNRQQLWKKHLHETYLQIRSLLYLHLRTSCGKKYVGFNHHSNPTNGID